MTTVFVNYY